MKIDDDIFEYEGGMKQCISNFGRQIVDGINEHCRSKSAQKRLGYGVGELVRWCKSLNRENQELKLQIEEMQEAPSSTFHSVNMAVCIAKDGSETIMGPAEVEGAMIGWFSERLTQEWIAALPSLVSEHKTTIELREYAVRRVIARGVPQ